MYKYDNNYYAIWVYHYVNPAQNSEVSKLADCHNSTGYHFGQGNIDNYCFSFTSIV